MILGDLTSLFQLGVALNLGFGALISFVEPAKRKRDASVYLIESELMLLSERHESEEPDNKEIEDIYDISRKYRQLFLPSIFSRAEALFWNGPSIRAGFLVCGLASFVGLVVASMGSKGNANMAFFVWAITTNALPMLVAVLMLAIGLWYQGRIFPLIDEIQSRLFRYRHIFYKKS